MNDLQKIVDLLKVRSYSIRELAAEARIQENICVQYIDVLKGLGVVYEALAKKKKEIYLRQLPGGPKIQVMSRFKAIDDIQILDEAPPKPDEVIDLISQT